jgi:ATP-dependent helicase/nuclease subunit A
MPRHPNPEQKLAIEHSGGVLLRAGAGSGKTFVLVEHLVYLTALWMEDFKQRPGQNFEDFLRSKYSKIVMMTFTKKAAGEMSIRLADRFEELSDQVGEDQIFWKTANELLPALMVTTIDGFCKRLISLGYFPHLSTEVPVIFHNERNDQVRTLVEHWLSSFSEKIDVKTLEIVFKEKEGLLSAFTNIFSDPGLRLEWKKFELDQIRPHMINHLLEDSFNLNNLAEALAFIYSLELDEEKNRSSFEKVIATFQASGLPAVTSLESFKIYTDLFKPLGTLPFERTKSKQSPASTAAKESLSQLRDWVEKWEEVIVDYQAHFETSIMPWMSLCLDIFNYIDKNLDPNLGMTFGDIEYEVSLGLENKIDRERIQKSFSYFIVDEFQDTSKIQFQIINNLIGGDFRRLFCVGDAKQAIYGFRGGELSVFQDCSQLVPSVKTLENNYRSQKGVIEFNNSLFKTILPLGYNFSGHDLFTVTAEDQLVPPETSSGLELGEVEVLAAPLKRNLEIEGKFKNQDINKLEAVLIADSIAQERLKSGHVCTVLYSKLTPSFELIRALMERKIGFTAQFKIELKDDPILGLFLVLLRRHFDSNLETKNKYPMFIIERFFKILNLPLSFKEEDFILFEQGVKYWGLVEAFRKFLYKLHITNENADINLEHIEVMAALYHQDSESIMSQLQSALNGDKVKLELRSGANAHMVQLMTAHASKGLEFDVVYLAGIYTNGRSHSERSLFGNLPGSFNWYLDIQTRKKQKSPLYLFEQDLSRYKEFSESKRLFYVACTRAKKKLRWVDFDIPEKAFSIPENSWILGLRTWMNTSKEFSFLKISPLVDFNSQEHLSTQSLPNLPLFFHDPVGIFYKGSGDGELLLAPELSVTRLNSLVDCPRKFYFSNILKVSVPGEEKNTFIANDDEEVATILRSSTERGTFIHEKIALGIEHNFIVPRDIFGSDLQRPVQWALDQLKAKTATYDLVPEKQIKFKFFNFMITGIPDLLCLPKVLNTRPQIWDFKTGRITSESLSHYWTQLSVYAYALYELDMVGPTQEIELVLCFVDEQKNLEKVITKEDCVSHLYALWRLQNEPWKTNTDHCSQCSYGSICPR